MAGLAGMADSCGKFGKLMDLGNKLMLGYQAQCGAWKGLCALACGDAVKSIEAAKVDLKTMCQNFSTQAKAAAARWRAKIPAGEEAARWYDKGGIDVPKSCESYSATFLDPELSLMGDYRPV